MQGMFGKATSFNQPLGSWDVGNVENMDGMFAEATSFNQPIGGTIKKAGHYKDDNAIDKTAFIDKLKNLDESSVIEIGFESKKWAINEKSIVTGEWNEKAYTLYADVLQKRADLIWEESLGELINLLAKYELGELNNSNCESLYVDSSDGGEINVIKIEWDSSLTDKEEEQFKEEFGDDGSQLYFDGDLEVEPSFETGAIIGIRVITEDEEFYLSEDK
jgi:hypothetical protein